MNVLKTSLIGAAFAALLCEPARSEDAALSLEIKDHKFAPAELHAPPDTPIALTVTNSDRTAEEFEMKQQRVEKVIAGGASATIHLRPLPKGKYRFFGEYHETTAQGALIVD